MSTLVFRTSLRNIFIITKMVLLTAAPIFNAFFLLCDVTEGINILRKCYNPKM